MAATRTRNEGKSSFVKEYLNDHPKSNPRDVNAAWQAAGMEGTISASLINKLRSQMGLAGNLRSGPKKGARKGAKLTGQRRGRPRKAAVAAEIGIRATGRRVRQLAEVEADLDRLLFTVMGLGDLARVEEALREARRSLYRHMNGSRA